jgi:hypothetical protein
LFVLADVADELLYDFPPNSTLLYKMASDGEFCCSVFVMILYIWFAFAWLISLESKEMKNFSRTEKFLMYDAVVDDPIISWFLSGK